MVPSYAYTIRMYTKTVFLSRISIISKLLQVIKKKQLMCIRAREGNIFFYLYLQNSFLKNCYKSESMICTSYYTYTSNNCKQFL